MSGPSCSKRNGWLARIVYTLSHGKTLKRKPKD